MTPADHAAPGTQSPVRADGDCATAPCEGAASSSTGALEAAYPRERHVLLGYLARRVGTDAASDLIQEVFVRAASTGNFTEIVNQRSYLMQIARNLLIDRWRAQKRAAVDFTPFEEERMQVAQPDPFWWIESADRVAAYKRAVCAMLPKAREVFLMSRLDQLSYREISDKLGLGLAPPPAVRSQWPPGSSVRWSFHASPRPRS